MDFETRDTPEMAAFRKEVRAYLQGIIPKNMIISAESLTDEQMEIRREMTRKVGARGWLEPMFPKEYGGGGLTADHVVVLAEEMDDLQMSLVGEGPVADILVWGTEDQKQRFLPPMLRGERVTWNLLTEPHGGSDLASAKTTAIRDGDEYVLNGTKTFVGNDYTPDQLWTIVMTDPQGPRHQNLSWIMVPADTPGVTRHKLDLATAGTTEPEGHKNSVFFEDARVPAFNLIGGENNGWKVANTHLELEHGGTGRVGRHRQLERLYEYCKANAFNGQAISKDPDARDILADVIVNGDIHRLFGLRNFWIRHTKKTGTYEGSQSIYWRRKSDLKNVLLVQEILGYLTIINQKPWAAADGWMEMYMRQGPRGLHGGGTDDIDRVIIARRMGLGRTVKEAAGIVD